MTTTMTAVCAALLGSLIIAAPARADADSCIATLDVMGVPYRNRAAAIQFGEVICRALEGGTPFDTLVTMTTSDGYYSTYQAKALIGAAVGGLCPQEQASVPTE
jgi:uncharacterized membrane protein